MKVRVRTRVRVRVTDVGHGVQEDVVVSCTLRCGSGLGLGSVLVSETGLWSGLVLG